MKLKCTPLLPSLERTLLRVAVVIVPGDEREEWLRTWEGELWHAHYQREQYRRNRHRRALVAADLGAGLLLDAVWLRTESWKRAFSGTALVCLVALAALGLLASVFALVLTGSWAALGPYLREHFLRTLVAAPLVVFVSFATASRRHLDESATTFRMCWVKRQLFLTAKMVLTLLLAFLLSADLCQPLHSESPGTADVLQLLGFVLFALAGLRWVFVDQQQRCKQCLQALAVPARVGRPSHNLLEWNGTEMDCKHGHGRLSVPEMETSWCQSSRWVDLA